MNFDYTILNKLLDELKNNKCFINGQIFNLEEIEKLGFDKFRQLVHNSSKFKLYKYYPNINSVNEHGENVNYSIDALRNNEVYLNDSINFDDCFDCAIDIDFDKFNNVRLNKYCEYFGIDTEDINNDNELLARKISAFLYEKLSNNKENDIYDSITDEIKKLKAEIFVKKLILDINQTNDFAISLHNILKEEHYEFTQALKNFKITCFSTSPYLNRMWSDYGNKNKGFCIEYEIDINNEKLFNNIFLNLFPVIYSQIRNDSNILCEINDDKLNLNNVWQLYFNGMLRKSLYWIDQCEWRLILYDKMMEANPIKFYKITKVYFGNKMNIEEKRIIKKICKDKNIKTTCILRENNSFNLIECQNLKKCYLEDKSDN